MTSRARVPVDMVQVRLFLARLLDGCTDVRMGETDNTGSGTCEAVEQQGGPDSW